MKVIHKKFVVFLFGLFVFASCNLQKVNSDREETTTETSSFSVKLFFEIDSSLDLDTEVNQDPIYEIKDFQTKRTYTFCYDSESFSKLVITGKSKNLTLEVLENGAAYFSKSAFSLEDSILFTPNDFMLNMGSEYTILVKQDQTEVFNAKIDSQGCM